MKEICESRIRQTRKPVYAAGWTNRPPSACRDSLHFIICECIKDSTIGEMADIETLVITGGNRAKTAL
jgi:hypothetical protein